MGRANTPQWESLERRSPTLFLSAGILLLGYATLNGVAAFTDTAYVPVEDVVGPAGFVLGFVGLLGLYPGFSDRNPTLAKAGVVCASLGAAGFSVLTIHGIGVLAGLESASVPAILLLPVAIGMIPGYLSFGVATLRTSAGERAVGLLLLLPAVVFAAMLAQPFVYAAFGMFSETTMAWSNFGISSGQAVAHLAIGYTLWARVSPAELDAPSTGTAVS